MLPRKPCPDKLVVQIIEFLLYIITKIYMIFNIIKLEEILKRTEFLILEMYKVS